MLGYWENEGRNTLNEPTKHQLTVGAPQTTEGTFLVCLDPLRKSPHQLLTDQAAMSQLLTEYVFSLNTSKKDMFIMLIHSWRAQCSALESQRKLRIQPPLLNVITSFNNQLVASIRYLLTLARHYLK